MSLYFRSTSCKLDHISFPKISVLVVNKSDRSVNAERLVLGKKLFLSAWASKLNMDFVQQRLTWYVFGPRGLVYVADVMSVSPSSE